MYELLNCIWFFYQDEPIFNGIIFFAESIGDISSRFEASDEKINLEIYEQRARRKSLKM